jgi:hypothetical protein
MFCPVESISEFEAEERLQKATGFLSEIEDGEELGEEEKLALSMAVEEYLRRHFHKENGCGGRRTLLRRPRAKKPRNRNGRRRSAS